MSDDDGTSAAGTWLEMSVQCDPEAVEAVSEILSRDAGGGVSVEQPFATEQEGLTAVPIEGAPVTIRAYLPAIDRSAADAAIATTRERLGHLTAFDLRPIGELRVREVHEEDWATAWKDYFPVMRLGRRIVIKPTWREFEAVPDDVIIALDPGMAFGTGLHPTTRLCLVGLERWADAGIVKGARTLDVGSGSGILAVGAALLGADPVRALDTDPIAVEIHATERAAQRRHHRCQPGQPAHRCRPVRPRLRQPRGQHPRPVGAGPGSDRAAGRRRPREWWSPVGLGHLHRSGAGGAQRSRRRRPPGGAPRAGDRLGGARSGAPWRVIPGELFPVLLTSHVILAISLFVPAFLLPFTMRTRGTDGDPVVGAQSGRFVRGLVWLEAHGTIIIGAGVAITGIGMLLVLGSSFLQQPWLLLALSIYATILIVAFFVQRPGVRRLLGLREAATEEEKERWRVRARRQRYISYVMAGAIGAIGWLMMSKPAF